MMKRYSSPWVRILALQAWVWLLVACNSELSVFLNSTTNPSLDKISSVTLNEEGRLQVEWFAKANAPASMYQVYLLQVPSEDTRFAFTSAALLAEPLSTEDITVRAAESPRINGTLVSSAKDLKVILNQNLRAESRYLLQVVEKNRKLGEGDEKVVLLQVRFKGFAATSAVASGDSVELNWAPVPGANRYEVYADKDFDKLVGTTTSSTIAIDLSSQPSAKEFFIRAYRGVMASPDVVAIQLSPSTVKIQKVSSATPNGKYTSGAIIELIVEFDAKASVFGESKLPLSLNGQMRDAIYVSGNGTSKLRYKYVVQAGDNSDGIQNGMILSGSIADSAGLNIAGNLPSVGSGATLAELSSIVIDTLPPTIPTSVGFNTAHSLDGNFDVSWSPSSDLYFKTHNLKLCSDSACSASCTGTTTSVTASKSLTGVPTGSYYACVQGEDSTGLLSAWASSIGTIQISNSAPSINSSPASQNAFTLSAIAPVDTSATLGTDADVDGQVVTYSCLFDKTINAAMDAGGTACALLPQNAYSFNASTGVLTWTPSAAAVNNNSSITTYEFQIRGTDTTSLTGTTYFTVSLLNPFSSSISYSAGTGNQYTYDTTQIEFVGGTAALTAIDMTDDDNSATGFLSGTHYGTKWYNTAPYFERLTTDAASSCNGGTTNCAGGAQDAWVPQIAFRNAVYSWESGTSPWSNGGASTPSLDTTNKKIGKQGLSFDGTSQFLTKAREFTDDFTVSYWIQTTQSYTGGTACTAFWQGAALVTADSSSQKDDWSSSMCDGYILAGIGNALGGSDDTVKTPDRYNDGLWHQVVFTRNKTTGEFKLYVDGDFIGSFIGSQNSLTSNTNWSIGGLEYWRSERYAGFFDELVSWSTVLSESEIHNLWERQASRFSGSNISRVMDSTSSSTTWTGLSWKTTKPFGKELPDYNGSLQNETTAQYQGISSNTLSNNLIGLWHFNEPTIGTAPGGADFTDDSGQGNHALKSDAFGVGKLGRFDKGVQFFGHDYVNIGSSPLFDFGAAAFTLSTWIKTNSKSIGRIYASKAQLTNVGIDLFILQDGTLVFGIGCTTGVMADCPYAQTVANHFNDGSWHNVVVMNDKPNDAMKIFVDGKIQTINTISGWGTCATLGPSNTSLVVTGCTYMSGNRSDNVNLFGTFANWNTPFTGLMDEAAIWKRALSTVELEELYRRGANRLLLQVRSCAQADCSDGIWKGPDGSSQTYFSELNNNSLPSSANGYVLANSPSLTYSNFPSLALSANRYFQYKYVMESDENNGLCSYAGGGACSPELQSVVVEPNGKYSTNSPSVVYDTGIPFYNLGGGGGFTASELCSSAGGVKYQLSIDKSSWYYWSGSAWTLSNGTLAQSSSMAALSGASSTFATAVARGNIFLKALLPSDGSTPCAIGQFDFTGNYAY